MTAKKILTFFLLLSVNVLAADYQLKVIDRFVALDNVCAWPNLTFLDDGTILAMVFSEPNHGRVDGDIQCFASTDAGKTFSKPKELVTLYAGDCGYPSTVQLKDGTLITAYYADKIPSHTRYHMGIIRYKLIPK